MDTHIPHPSTPNPADIAALADWPEAKTFTDAEKKRLGEIADVRMFARLESAMAACVVTMDALKVHLDDRAERRKAQIAETEQACGADIPVRGDADVGGTDSVGGADRAGKNARATGESKPRIRTGIMSISSLLTRVAHNVLDLSHLLNALEHDLIHRGIDVHAEVYRRRIKDMFDEYTREIGADKATDEFAILRLHDGLARIEEVVDDARARVEAAITHRGWVGTLRNAGMTKTTPAVVAAPSRRSTAAVRQAHDRLGSRSYDALDFSDVDFDFDPEWAKEMREAEKFVRDLISNRKPRPPSG